MTGEMNSLAFNNTSWIVSNEWAPSTPSSNIEETPTSSNIINLTEIQNNVFNKRLHANRLVI